MVRAAEVEVLITANDDQVGEADKRVQKTVERLEKTTATKKITADDRAALASMDRVETAAKRLVSNDTALKLDADISRAEKQLDKTRARIEDLQVRALGGLEVTADTRRAESSLAKTERQLAALQSARALIEVDANTVPAEVALAELAAKAEVAGRDGGTRGGSAFVRALDSVTRGAGTRVGEVIGDGIGPSLERAMIAIPLAGGIILAGVAIGKAISGAINDGLTVDSRNDRLQGLTGISEANALRLGRAAGEAYAQNFGQSIEANMDTTRLGLQFDLIDENSTSKDARKVIEGLSGIADALDEDVRPVATTVTTLLRTGLAKSADEAFDIIAAGSTRGLNRADDLLDTLTEYPVLLARLGLNSKDSLGLLNQGLTAGARNSDIVADALKEFQIRATDSSVLSAQGFELIGLNAEEMTAKIAAGGDSAREGLAEVLDGLRAIEDPVARNTAAVALFGTQAEDLGGALFSLDLNTAAGQFDNLAGSAQRMFDTLSSNDAAKIETAQRNIEVAMDGIRGALASAFADPLGEAADFVTKNRGPIMQFLLDMANGAIDFGISMVSGIADGEEALGHFVAGPGATLVDLLITVQKLLHPGGDYSEMEKIASDMRGFDEATSAGADNLRRNLIDNGLVPAKERLNEFGEGAVAMGFLNDASLRLADSVGKVGVAADGSALSLEGVDLANLRASDSGKLLEGQVRGSVSALAEQIRTAADAGEGQDQLAERYHTGTDAIAAQLTAMGLTDEQARTLIDTILRTPASATTSFDSNVIEEQGNVDELARRITTLPDGTVVVDANTRPAQETIDEFIRQNGVRNGVINYRANLPDLNGVASGSGRMGTFGASGYVLDFMARGGLTPMQPVAQVVPASTWRVVGDRSDVSESYIPLDGSPRSMAILLETMRRMGVSPMAEGGVDRAPVAAARDDRPLVHMEVIAGPGQSAETTGRVAADQINFALGG